MTCFSILSRLVLLAIILFLTGSIQAQVPQGINYQAVARDNESILTNTQVKLRLSIVHNGQIAYQEEHTQITNAYGLINLIIGQGNSTQGDFSEINWSQGNYQLTVEMDSGSGSFQDMGSSDLVSVPYSLYADKANMELKDLKDVSDQLSPSNGQILKWNGTEWKAGNDAVGSPDGGGFWQQNQAGNIYHDGGLVGIGIDDPLDRLSVLGTFSVKSTNGNFKAGAAWITSSDNGAMWTFGQNNDQNILLGSFTGYPGHGYVTVFDENGFTTNPRTGMLINGDGQGVVFGDQKNFRMPHPTLPGKEIWYCSLEGPEAAAYARGTGTLVNGKVSIKFDDHFRLVANESTMTITLTPLSASSKGLAVVKKGKDGFDVQELWEGKGNYQFDWEVKAVREGYEDYRVIRDASESAIANPGIKK